jgi:hypothetical protein
MIVELERTGRFWIAIVPDVPGCFTFGSNLRRVTFRMRDALTLFRRRDPRFEFVLAAGPLHDLVAEASGLRSAADDAARQAVHALSRAVHAMDAAGVSRRDAAHLLGISHQRVQQLIDR